MITSTAGKKALLPAFRALALSGFSASAPFLALLLLLGRVWMGVSLLSGYALGMLIYGVLYQVVTHGFSAASSKKAKKLPANFGLLMFGKLFIFGGAVAFLLCVLHVAALWMLAGLFVTQIGVTAAVMRHLKENKVTN